MNMKRYKYIIAFVLAFMALPMMAQDYMNIFFKNGDFRKFYMKNITEIVATKVDAEGVEHEDYSYQQITTIYDKYIYKLEDVDSITFTKIDEELAEHNFVTAMPQVFSAIGDCETIADVEKKIDQIKNTEGVVDAWSDGHALECGLERRNCRGCGTRPRKGLGHLGLVPSSPAELGHGQRHRARCVRR